MSDSKVRLVYTEPNLYAAEAAGVKFGNGNTASNMTWNPEDLNISVDLQVVIPRRSDCGEITQNLPVTFSNGLGAYTSFLSGSKVGDSNYLTIDYTEASYSEIRNNNVSTTESLGISSIDIKFDAHFYPQVTMKFTDVRGYSLFMPAEEEYVNKLQTRAYNAGNAAQPGRPYTNLFKAIFHFPYPKFLLTVKGFYGNKVTFILAVNDFKTALNGQNGNFDVTISFIGYMYGLYTDVPMSYIMIAPYLDSKDGQLTEDSYWIKRQKEGCFVSKAANSSGEGENATQLIPTFLELARNYAELDIESDDTLGTETEEYYTIQSAYNSLNDIIKDYKDLVDSFYEGCIIHGKSNSYDLYLINPSTDAYSWDKNDKAKELYNKITEHISKYSGEEFKNCKLTYPTLLRNMDHESEFSVDLSTLTSVELDKDNEYKKLKYDGSVIFPGLTYERAKENDDSFEDKLFSLLRNVKKDTVYTLIAFNGEHWIKDTTNKLTTLGELKDNKMKDAAMSAVKLYSDKLGYALTIENVFRMVFAHVECFFHYYLEDTVYQIRDDASRTFKKLGLDYNMTDSDGIAVNNDSKLLPFPAIYNKSNELEYPGENMRTVEMLEVDLVERLHEAAKMCGEEAAKVSELMALNQQADHSEELVSSNDANFPLPVSFDGSFKPLTFMDAFCECKNPYKNLPKTKTEDKPNYSLVDEILYMAYLRYCTYMMSIYPKKPKDISYINEFFIGCEYDNIISTFSSFNDEERKRIHYLTQHVHNHEKASEYGVYYTIDSRGPIDAVTNADEKLRIGYDFSLPYTGNTVLCTDFDTSTCNKKENLGDIIKTYTKDYLRGVHILPESAFDVFNKMNKTVVSATDDSEGYKFERVNYLMDIREADYLTYGQCVIRYGSVPSFNTVYYLNEEGRKYFGDKKETDNKTNEEQESKSSLHKKQQALLNGDRTVMDHTSSPSYFNFIKQGRTTLSSYKGIYSPGPLFVNTNNKTHNLFLSQFFWKQKDDEARAFLLLSAYIASNNNNNFFKLDDLSKIGTQVYRLRKLSVLYYGALINRLRHQVETLYEVKDKDKVNYTGVDLVVMDDKNGDNFGINKDVFNNYTESAYSYIKYGEYYYPALLTTRDRRRFTEDAPLLTTISINNSSDYHEYAKKGGILEKSIISVLSSTTGPSEYHINGDTKKALEELLKVCQHDEDIMVGLEGYFLNWVKTEFKDFLDLLKNEYVKIENDKGKIVVKKYTEKWCQIIHSYNGEYEAKDCFKYSEEETSPNMFLNKLQCEQVTVLMCVPNEKRVDTDKDMGHKDFLDDASTTLQKLFKKLESYYNEKAKEETKEEAEKKADEKRDTDDSSLKKATYYVLKNLYDKWICGYGDFNQFKLPTPHDEFAAKRLRYEQGDYYGEQDFKEMNNFLFVDAFYNDISDTFYCNPKLLYDLIMSCINGEYKCSIYQFIAKLAQDNKLLMRAFPVYNNFYNVNTINDIFTPHMSYDVANNSMVKRGFGSTYLLMYTNQPSKFLNEESKTEIMYRDDSFDLGDSLGHVAKLDTQFSTTKDALNLPVPAFGVTYGMQNQQYFKGMNINMDSPITTDYSIANVLMLSQTGAKGDKNFPMGVGQDIYAIYSNRSYTITVEMMGCANIMPMMYFQLNNVPMFKGAYMIVSVSHSIKAGSMTTTFTGVRQTKYLYPTVTENMILTSIVDRMNKERGEQSSSRGNPAPAQVEGVPCILDNLILDNALGETYKWTPKSNGTPYPYKKRLYKPKYIILHYTAGTSSAPGMAGKLMSTWVNIWNNSDTGGGSADFGVDDANIYQFTPDIDTWRASYCNGGTYDADGRGGRTQHDDAHLCGIGIEMCCEHTKGTSFKQGNHSGWKFTDKVIANTVELCVYLIKHFKMPCNMLLDDNNSIISTHYRVSGKVCPGIKGWNNAKWNDSDSEYNNEDRLKEFRKRVWNRLVDIGYIKA